MRCSQQILCARTGCGAMRPIREGESLLKMSMRAGASRATPIQAKQALLPSLMVRQASATARAEHKAPVSSRGSSSPEHLTSTPHRGRFLSVELAYAPVWRSEMILRPVFPESLR